MNKNFTQDYSAFEEDANYWFSVFDNIPDIAFAKQEVSPGSFIVNKIKAFARAYQPMVVLDKEVDLIIN